jgi:hypothetical protein
LGIDAAGDGAGAAVTLGGAGAATGAGAAAEAAGAGAAVIGALMLVVGAAAGDGEADETGAGALVAAWTGGCAG